MIKKIIKIDEEKCNGCALCTYACHEGAIGMVDGESKASKRRSLRRARRLSACMSYGSHLFLRKEKFPHAHTAPLRKCGQITLYQTGPFR